MHHHQKKRPSFFLLGYTLLSDKHALIVVSWARGRAADIVVTRPRGLHLARGYDCQLWQYNKPKGLCIDILSSRGTMWHHPPPGARNFRTVKLPKRGTRTLYTKSYRTRYAYETDARSTTCKFTVLYYTSASFRLYDRREKLDAQVPAGFTDLASGWGPRLRGKKNTNQSCVGLPLAACVTH